MTGGALYFLREALWWREESFRFAHRRGLRIENGNAWDVARREMRRHAREFARRVRR